MQKKLLLSIILIVYFMSFFNVNASSLWSTLDTHGGTGKFLGPGRFKAEQELFEMVLKNVAFTNKTDFLVPFYNNGKSLPNICGELDLDEKADGRLSSSLEINENADMCLANIAGTDMLIAVIDNGPLQGQIHFMILDNQEILVAMDIAFDLGIGDKGVIKMPFYGSTNQVMIPYSIQTHLGIPGGTDSAGNHLSGTWLKGRVGDFDEDGWLDGTLVSAGNIPLDSPVFPGQPYAMIRHFEMDIPYGGYVLGNVKEAFEQNN